MYNSSNSPNISAPTFIMKDGTHMLVSNFFFFLDMWDPFSLQLFSSSVPHVQRRTRSSQPGRSAAAVRRGLRRRREGAAEGTRRTGPACGAGRPLSAAAARRGGGGGAARPSQSAEAQTRRHGAAGVAERVKDSPRAGDGRHSQTSSCGWDPQMEASLQTPQVWCSIPKIH